jgi:hypothetical protein
MLPTLTPTVLVWADAATTSTSNKNVEIKLSKMILLFNFITRRIFLFQDLLLSVE